MNATEIEAKVSLLVLLAMPFLVLSAYGVRVLAYGRPLNDRVAHQTSSALFGRFLIEAFHWVLTGLGRSVARIGISPDALTLISLFISLASLPAAALGHLSWAGVLLLAGAMFDVLDGVVAREQGLASDSGEVLDAIVDRYADGAPLIGLLVFYRESVTALLLVGSALVGSMLVSYVRSKAESLGLKLRGGLMRRHERIAYLSGGLLIGPLVALHRVPFAAPLTLLSVAVVGFMSHLAAVLLTRSARAELVAQGRGPGSST
ncbi:MAG TPA: CDP-alcohol phosphatidyltransferase family protein [Polyangiaceae bacterium]|jgi:CDP-diacylglycerol--glycerol-3-phosphate 3-phosphatidyltransferase